MMDEQPTGHFSGNAVEFAVRRDRDRPFTDGFARLFVSGELTAGGRDHRLIVEINDETTGYRGFIKGDGDDGCGEWESDGIYLGRNAWHLDAQFSADICISVNSATERIMASSLTSFASSDHRLIGYQTCGMLLTSKSLNKIRVRFLTSAAAKGFAKLLLFPA